MARIRALKPSFFTNEDLAELSFAHRLCFEGLWCHADREGRLEDRPRRLKAAIFPYDDVDMDALLQGLHDAHFIQRYQVDGSSYIAVRTFRKHQRPKSDEAVSVIPAPLLEDPRGNGAGPLRSDTVPRGSDTAPRIGNREIGNREGEKEAGSNEPPAADAADSHRQRASDFAELWNRLTEPPIPRCRELTTSRRRHIRTRLTERPLTEWEDVMRRIQASSFCRGENDRGWTATFDWLVSSPDVGAKVLEGKYDNRVPAKPQPNGSAPGVRYVPSAEETARRRAANEAIGRPTPEQLAQWKQEFQGRKWPKLA